MAKEEKNSTSNKGLKILGNVLFVILIILTILLVGVRLFGLQPFTILSGSMEPTYHVGSLIYVRKTAPDDVEVGDPITYVLNEDLVVATHRVVDIDEENQRFITKGDANEIADAGVHFKNLIGIPKFSIPYLGYVANFLSSKTGIYFLIGVFVLLAFIFFFPDDNDKEETEKVNESTDGNKNIVESKKIEETEKIVDRAGTTNARSQGQLKIRRVELKKDKKE